MRLIDADKLFKEVGEIKPRNKEHYKSIGEFMNMITNSKTIDIRPKGEWIWKSDENYAAPAWTCSKCGSRKVFKHNFCPNCGASMKG